MPQERPIDAQTYLDIYSRVAKAIQGGGREGILYSATCAQENPDMVGVLCTVIVLKTDPSYRERGVTNEEMISLANGYRAWVTSAKAIEQLKDYIAPWVKNNPAVDSWVAILQTLKEIWEGQIQEPANTHPRKTSSATGPRDVTRF